MVGTLKLQPEILKMPDVESPWDWEGHQSLMEMDNILGLFRNDANSYPWQHQPYYWIFTII